MMAEKSGILGILRGIQNVLVLRRQRRMAEAKQELQNVNFQMLQRKHDLAETEHKSAQVYRKMQAERAKFIKTDQGLMDITDRTIVKGTEPQPEPMSAADALRQQEAAFKSRAMNILNDPNSTPQEIRFAEAQLGMAPQRPMTVSPGAALVDPTTGQPVYTAPEREQRPMTVSPGAALVDPTTGQPIYTAPERERPPQRPISVSPGGTLVDPSTGEPIYTAPEREPRPTSLMRDMEVLKQIIPSGASAAEKKFMGDAKKAIRIRYGLEAKPGKTSEFEKRVKDFEKRYDRELTEDEYLTLINVHGVKRQPTPKLMSAADGVSFLTNVAIMLTGKPKNNGADAVKELKKNPEKYLASFIEQVHALGGGTTKEQIPAFYGYASQMIGKKINPRGAGIAQTEQVIKAPEALAPAKTWQEVVDRGQPITDAEYQILLKTIGDIIPDNLIDAIADLHIWEE